MFHTSVDQSIAPALQPIVDEIEERTPGLYVVAAQQYSYPAIQSAYEVWVTEPRRFNVLEEFILRAARDLQPPPAIADLAEAFGLAPVFLEKTYQDLANCGALTLGEDSAINLTSEGRDFYEQGQIPQPPKRERIFCVVDPLTSQVTARTTPAPVVRGEFPPLSNVVELDSALPPTGVLPLDEVQRILQSTLPGMHDPGQGKIVTQVNAAGADEMLSHSVSLFLLYDDLEARWSLQARTGKARLAGAQQLLDSVLEKGPSHFLERFDVPGPPEEEGGPDEAAEVTALEQIQRHSRIEETVRETLRRERKAMETPSDHAPESGAGAVDVLRNEKIRPEFIRVLNSAKREVIIFSPWITEQVMDAEFISMLRKLAARNVWVLIGHGIAKSRDREDRQVPAAVLEKIHAIRSPQGAPTVRVVWLGGSHAKELVVDTEVFLHGSFNWLSYRGDRAVRGETVSRITVPELVDDARSEYRELFLKRAREMWEESSLDASHENAISALGIMGALGNDVESLKLIHTSGRYDLLPQWTRIVGSNIVHRDVAYGAGCLSEASELLAEVRLDELLETDLETAWKATIKQIQGKNVDLAQELLQHRFYAQLRNSIAPFDESLYVETPSKGAVTFAYKKSKKKKK